ncbi:MAG: tRNA (adenosine(37)-N6)-threonylcarbamoyltransferase complex ATPase subunit type 1 TsaE [Bacteroidota bacterium]|nr:tRNA (adenosine(37)-N6)-threonylcarbamoyltransferase complex ATPase subunit type 1 TsaE [Bacteroidota bacterium]
MNITFTQSEIPNVAQQLWEWGKPFSVWAFEAPMGAGKTTFIHSLCVDVLQTTDAVSSPTFAIINEYKTKKAQTVYHMDWYRLRGEEEAIAAGVEDALQSGSLCLVEWAEVAPRLLPANTLHIQLIIVDDITRQLLATA